MDKLIPLIGSYRERDKFIRFCQYLLRFLVGSRQTRLSARLGKIADELGNCRAVLRLFDDVPMLAYNLRYGFGKREPNGWMRFLQLVSNCANQLYYPLEHISWLAKKQVIDVQPSKWGTACIVAWAVALASGILQAISKIMMIRNAQKVLLKEQKLDVQHESEPSEMSHDIRSQMRNLKAQERDNWLAFIEHSADFINAVNWLPPGYLWSEKFSPKFSGGMGTISSFIKLYRLHSAKR